MASVTVENKVIDDNRVIAHGMAIDDKVKNEVWTALDLYLMDSLGVPYIVQGRLKI